MTLENQLLDFDVAKRPQPPKSVKETLMTVTGFCISRVP